MYCTDKIFIWRVFKRVTYIVKNIFYSSQIYVKYKFDVNSKIWNTDCQKFQTSNEKDHNQMNVCSKNTHQSSSLIISKYLTAGEKNSQELNSILREL